MYYPFSWLRSLGRLAAYFLVVILLGWYYSEPSLAVAIGALLLLASHYWNIYRLNHWLWQSKKITPPRVNGVWEHIYDGIYTLQRRNRTKRKELGLLVKRFREGSEALPDAAVVVDANASIS